MEYMLQSAEDLPKEARKNSVMMEHGLLDQAKVQHLLSEMEQRVMDRGLPKGVMKRTFNILVEALQNMCIHGHSTEQGVPFYLHLWQEGEELRIRVMNLSQKSVKDKVKAQVLMLNALDKDSIKQHYRERMSNGDISDKGGAGLGLITMVMRSKDGLRFKWEKIHDGFGIIIQELDVA